LSDALKKALEDRVDEAVSSGQITKAQGDTMKAKIEAGGIPLFFGPPDGGFGGRGGFDGPRGFGLGVGPVGAGLDSVATALGITESQLQTELQSGKTLAQIATDHGKTAADVVNALVADAQSKLDAAVKAGKLTQSQADALESDLKSKITDLVNGTMPDGRFGGPGAFRFGLGLGGKFDSAAKAIGITDSQLQTELQSGKTLAQIATEHGKTAADVVNALVADAQTRLDAAVKAGKLTQAQADSLLSDLKSHITDLVNGKVLAGPFGPSKGLMPGFREFRGFHGGSFNVPPPTPPEGAPGNTA